MVAAEHGDKVGREVFNQVDALVDRIGSADKPCFLGGPHLGWNGDYETAFAVGSGNIPSIDDVFHQALRAELGQHEHAVYSAVDEITEYEVYDSIFAAERNRRFGSFYGKRMEPGAFSTGKYHPKN